jgi:hypothetical protein
LSGEIIIQRSGKSNAFVGESRFFPDSRIREATADIRFETLWKVWKVKVRHNVSSSQCRSNSGNGL